MYRSSANLKTGSVQFFKMYNIILGVEFCINGGIIITKTNARVISIFFLELLIYSSDSPGEFHIQIKPKIGQIQLHEITQMEITLIS